MKTYYIMYARTGQEESVQATSLRVTSKVISFLRGKAVTFVVPVTEIMRVGENRFGPLAEPEVKIEQSEKLRSARAWLETRRKSVNSSAEN